MGCPSLQYIRFPRNPWPPHRRYAEIYRRLRDTGSGRTTDNVTDGDAEEGWKVECIGKGDLYGDDDKLKWL